MLDIGMNKLVTGVKSEDTYQSLLKELSVYDKALTAMTNDIGTEGFGDAVYATWTGMVDVLVRLGNNFKTNVFKSYLNLKRSEIRYYSESNFMQIRGVESLGIHQVVTTPVPMPSGMTCKYKTAVDSVLNVYQVLNAKSTLTNVKQCFNNVYRSLSLEDGKHADYLKQFTNSTINYSNTVKAALAACDKLFTELRTDNVVFTDAYNSMEEFRQVRQQLIGMESYLQNTTALEKSHEDLVEIVCNVSTVLSKESTVVDKNFLTDLSNVVRLTATLFEAYGINAQRQCALEHNHIEVIRSLWTNTVMGHNQGIHPSNESLSDKTVREYDSTKDAFYSPDDTPHLFLSATTVTSVLAKLKVKDTSAERDAKAVIIRIEKLNRQEKKSDISHAECLKLNKEIASEYLKKHGYWPYVSEIYKAFYNSFRKHPSTESLNEKSIGCEMFSIPKLGAYNWTVLILGVGILLSYIGIKISELCEKYKKAREKHPDEKAFGNLTTSLPDHTTLRAMDSSIWWLIDSIGTGVTLPDNDNKIVSIRLSFAKASKTAGGSFEDLGYKLNNKNLALTKVKDVYNTKTDSCANKKITTAFCLEILNTSTDTSNMTDMLSKAKQGLELARAGKSDIEIEIYHYDDDNDYVTDKVYSTEKIKESLILFENVLKIIEEYFKHIFPELARLEKQITFVRDIDQKPSNEALLLEAQNTSNLS